MITTTLNNETHTILFDAGPESKSIARNLKALKTDVSTIERIVLSVSMSARDVRLHNNNLHNTLKALARRSFRRHTHRTTDNSILTEKYCTCTG